MPRISYVPLEQMDDEMHVEMERCARHGTPRPESSAVRAHSPEIFKTFTAYWEATFRQGVLDHAIKELARLYITRTTKCQFCGNQRSTTAGLPEYAVRRAAQLREVRPLRRPAEGGPGLRPGHRLERGRPRRTLGPA